MSGRDDILLNLKLQTQGIESLNAVASQIVALQSRALAMQNQQAATTTKAASSLGAVSAKFNAVETATTSLERAYGGLNATLLKIPGAFALIDRAAQSAFMVFDAGRGIIEAGADMEKWQAAFTVLLGGADKARAHLEVLQQYANTTPFTLPQVVQASKLLEGLGLETQKYLGTLGNVAATLDRPLSEAVLAISAAQRGELENLKSFGINVQQIANKVGVDLMAGGRRSAEDSAKIAAGVMEYWQEKYAGMTEVISKTTGGLQSTWSDMVDGFKRKIAGSGIGDAFREQLLRLMARFDELEKNGTLDKWAHNISAVMENTIHAVENAANSVGVIGKVLDTLRGPLAFLVGAGGFYALNALLALSVTRVLSLVALSPQLIAFMSLWRAHGLVQTVDAATVGMGGLRTAAMSLVSPLGIAALAVGGVSLAVSLLADSLAKPFKLRIEFDASRDAVIEELHRLEAERGRLSGKRAAVAEGISLGGRISLPIADAIAGVGFGKAEDAARDARKAVDAQLKRAIGAAAPPLQSSVPAATGTAGGGPDRDAAAAAKKSFDDAVKRAQDFVNLEIATGQKIATAAADSVQRRIDLEAKGGADRAEVLNRIDRDAFERAAAFAQARLDAEVAIEGKRAAAVRAAASSGGPDAAVAEVTRRANEQAAIERRALEQSFADGSALLEFDRQIGLKRAALAAETAEAVAEAERKGAQERRAVLVDAIRFEVDATGKAAQEIVQETASALLAAREGSAEWLALLERLGAATKVLADDQDRLNAELAKFAALGVDAARAAALAAKGIKPEDVARVGGLTGTTGGEAANLTEASKANADLEATIANTESATERMRATWGVFFNDLGFGWEGAAQAARVATAGMSGAATGAYKTMEAAALRWFKFHQGTHALGLAIVKSAAREGAAAALDAIASIMKAEGAKEAAAAIGAVAKAFEFPPLAAQFLAAAGKHALAAAAYGVGAAAYGVGAAVTGAGAQSIRDQGAQEQAAAGAGAGAGAASNERGAQSTRLRTVAGNAPITQNFNVAVNFLGGLNLFGPEAAIALAHTMRPVLQQMLNDRELVVPTPGGG